MSAEQPVLEVFLNRDGQSFGPYSWEELWGHFQAGTVVGTDLAWHEGLANWQSVEQLFAPTPSPTPTLTPMPQPSPTPEMVKPVGPLFIAGSTEAKPLADPSALSVSAPKTAEKPKEDAKPKVKKKKWERWQDIQLPRWSKWALAGGVLLLLVVWWFFIGGTEKVERVPQVFGQAVRDALNKPEGDLTKADYEKVTELKITGKGFTDLKLLLKCPGVVKLDLSGNKITDVSSLAELSKLEKLSLFQNEINDFKPLERLSSLKELIIEGNPGASESTTNALTAAISGIKFPKTLSK